MSDQPNQPLWAPIPSSHLIRHLATLAPRPDTGSKHSLSRDLDSSPTSDAMTTNAAASGSRPAAASTPGRSVSQVQMSSSGNGGAAGGVKGKGPQHIAPGTSQGQAQPQGQASGPPKAKKRREGEGKRKKVAKACLVCQRSHLTCDEKRPCTRCVKKGIADQCVEGVRKKAKYLMEGEMEDVSDYHNPNVNPASSISPAASSSNRPNDSSGSVFASYVPAPPSPQPTLPTLAPSSSSGHISTLPIQSMANMGMEDDIWLAPQIMGGTLRADSPGPDVLRGTAGTGLLDNDVGVGGMEGGEGLWGDSLFGNGGFDFGTSASNEYQMLDAMLNSMSPVFPFDGLSNDNSFSLDSLQPQQTHQPHNPYLSDQLNTSSSGLSMLPGRAQNPPYSRSYPNQQSLISPSWPISSNPSNTLSAGINTTSPNHLSVSPGQPSSWTNWTDGQSGITTGSFDQMGGAGASQVGGGVLGGSGIGQEQGEMNVWGGSTAGGASGNTGGNKAGGRTKNGADVYHSVVKPFDYTEGYHKLMEYISRNFQQKEVLRVVKALAAFRPSLIALQMPMSEEDEVFLERSFQRTLIELEKLISYSATPTAVWRRTGELVYANPEFCGLIGKQQDDLLSGRTYVYQLFAKQATISYWENFSVHAFENTTQNFFQAVTLEVGEISLACSCCFTIRRDVFDLPSVIIGQFLPMPTD